MKIIKTLTVEIPNELIPYWQGYLDGSQGLSSNPNTPDDVKLFFKREIEDDNLMDWALFSNVSVSEEWTEEG